MFVYSGNADLLQYRMQQLRMRRTVTGKLRQKSDGSGSCGWRGGYTDRKMASSDEGINLEQLKDMINGLVNAMKGE